MSVDKGCLKLILSSSFFVYHCYPRRSVQYYILSGRWQAPRSTRKTNSEGIARRAMSSARRAESS